MVNNNEQTNKSHRTTETKGVKINAELHKTLKTHVVISDDGTTMTDHVNKAVTEYFDRYNIKPIKR